MPVSRNAPSLTYLPSVADDSTSGAIHEIVHPGTKAIDISGLGRTELSLSDRVGR
jgi:hypothetical protein